MTLRLGLIALFAVGCGPKSPASTGSNGPVEEAATSTDTTDVGTSPLLTPDGVFDCAANAAQRGGCDGDEGCISVLGGGCRPIDNACEPVVPTTVLYVYSPSYTGSTRWPVGESVTFRQGDPCASVDADCAYSPTKGVCEPFAVVPECPDTAEEAAAVAVSCMHPDQPKLECIYPGIRYECRVPWRPTGGAAPPEGYNDVPVRWVATPDYDSRGCPATQRARDAACTPPTGGSCVMYDVRYTCPNGVWEGEPLPPRP